MNKQQSSLIKRVFDILFSLVALVLLTPLFFVFGLMIKISSNGPIFYGGKRYGKDKRLFRCWKFRTMHVGAEAHLQEVLATHPEFHDEWTKFRKLKEDPRVFPFGRFLRKYSLDELPQFWNAFTGTMSVVGPRAYLPEEIDEMDEIKAHKILSTRPGITGLWQISGRNLLSFEERIKHDMRYVDMQSLKYDMYVIGKTVTVVLKSKGAY